jgi:hypothetical protein
MIDAWRFAVTVDKRLEKNTSFVLGVDKHNVPFKAKTSDPKCPSRSTVACRQGIPYGEGRVYLRVSGTLPYLHLAGPDLCGVRSVGRILVG